MEAAPRYACIYCKGRLERYWNGLMSFFKQKVGWVSGVNDTP